MKGTSTKCTDCAAKDEILERYLTKFMDLVDEFGESMVGEDEWQRWRLQEAEFLLMTNGYRVEPKQAPESSVIPGPELSQVRGRAAGHHE